AVFPDPAVARDRVLQRWPEWAAEGLVDVLCPMAYRRDTAEVERVLSRARAAAPNVEMWGGLMAYKGERDLLHDQVRAASRARRVRARGPGREAARAGEGAKAEAGRD